MLEPSLRLSGAILLVATLLVVGVHRWRAARSGGRISRRAEGLAMMIGLRVVGGLLWLGVILWLAAPDRLRWAERPVPEALRWSGAALIALGIGLVAWVLHHLGRNLTDTVITRANATLVRSGPYRWVRHPFYVVAAILIAGWALLTANAFLAVAGAVTFALLVLRSRTEERFLVERFGDDYRDYMRSTGAFLPRGRHS